MNKIIVELATDEDCLQYIERMRWPNGIVRCPLCGSKSVEKYVRPLGISKKRLETRDEERAKRPNRRRWFYKCRESTCRNNFSPTSGTLFHDTHLPVIVWFQAIALLLNANKATSPLQLQRELGIGSYKTAWYLSHRIRQVMSYGALPQLCGIVEIAGNVPRRPYKAARKK